MRKRGTSLISVRSRYLTRTILGDINRPGAELVKSAQAVEREELITTVVTAPVIPSSPATFNLTNLDLFEDVTFAIPAGTYVSGIWRIVGSYNRTTSMFETVVTPVNSTDFAIHGTGAFDSSAAVTAAQLADINAAAGGNLSARLTANTSPLGPAWTEGITLFTLSLTGSGGVTYELFIFGVHPLDGGSDGVTRYIP